MKKSLLYILCLSHLALFANPEQIKGRIVHIDASRIINPAKFKDLVGNEFIAPGKAPVLSRKISANKKSLEFGKDKTTTGLTCKGPKVYGQCEVFIVFQKTGKVSDDAHLMVTNELRPNIMIMKNLDEGFYYLEASNNQRPLFKGRAVLNDKVLDNTSDENYASNQEKILDQTSYLLNIQSGHNYKNERGDLWIGARYENDRGFVGSIAEFIIYNRPLTEKERQSVTESLKRKWQLKSKKASQKKSVTTTI